MVRFNYSESTSTCVSVLQEKLNEAQRKEQEFNAELQQCRDDLAATKVLSCITHYDCAIVSESYTRMS